MATPSDLTQTGPALIFEMVNRLNPNPPKGTFSASNVTLGVPTTLTNDISGKNATLLLTAVPGQGYLSTLPINYNRLDIRQVLIAKHVPDVRLTNNSFQKSVDLLPLINSTYNLNLQASDVVNETLPADDPSSPTGDIAYTLKIDPASLAYFGQLPLTLQAPSLDMARALKMNVLNGFVPPDTTLINIASILTQPVLNCFTVAQLQTPAT